MRKQPERLSTVHIRRYALYLREQERAPATIQKYLHDLHVFLEYLDGRPLTKAVLIGGKEELTANHAPASVNSMLAAVGGFLRFMGWEELRVKPLKIQRSPFCDEERELTRAEYARQGGYNAAQGGMAIREYADYDAISRYALEAMDWANAAGILNGTSATMLAPQGQAARAQAAAMLTRLCQTAVQEV